MGRTSPNAAVWRDIAVARARALRQRMAFSILIAVGGAWIGNRQWPAIWLAATTVAQYLSLRVTEPIRRNPGMAMSSRRQIAFYVGLGLSASVFAAAGPLFWFSNGSGGRLFAVIVLAGGAVNVALQARDSARQLWIGCAPFMLLLLALPLVSLAQAHGTERHVMALTALATLLIVLHLGANGHRSVASARRVKEALLEARCERQRAEEASAAKSDFLGVMSHELRTPLNGVLGMAQAMAADQLSPAQRERLEVIRQSGEILLLLLNDVLDISRIETARLEFAEARVDLTALAAQAQAVFAPLAEAKGVGFELRLESAAGAARLGDPTRVRQLLHKLIGNAVKFTEAGGVAVTIDGTGEELVFEVADSGPGIAADQLERIFDRFSQDDPSAARRHGGVGLGLAIARGLARAMGGEVTVRSAPGAGAVFTARLRLPATEAPALEPPATAPLAAPERLRVLAAEDNPTNQLVLRTLLEQVGLAVHLVPDGEAAVSAWRAADWDIVLMDIQMPGMDGLAATRAIRALEAADGRARTPIVAVTADATEQQAAEYASAGMDGLVPKPIQLSRLAAVMTAVAEAAAEDQRSAA